MVAVQEIAYFRSAEKKQASGVWHIERIEMKIKAAVLREFNKPVSIEVVDLAPPKENEVLVKTAYTGFCHSDLHFVRGTVNFGLPAVIGHEAAGVVEDVGPV
jgi:S-(hydroxymethyl)glutathione dehydrogenase/alcohol dehydrogenase